MSLDFLSKNVHISSTHFNTDFFFNSIPREEHWRFLVDGRYQKRKDSFPIVAYPNLPTPAYQFMLGTLDQPLTADLLQKYHRLATPPISPMKSTDVMVPTPFREEKRARPVQNGFNGTPGGMQEILDNKRTYCTVEPESEKYAGAEVESFTTTNQWSESNEKDTLTSLVDKILNEYREGIRSLENPTEDLKLGYIVRCIQDLVDLYPFNHNNETVISLLLLNRLLIENNLSPTILDSREAFAGYTDHHLIQEIKLGWQNVEDVQTHSRLKGGLSMQEYYNGIQDPKLLRNLLHFLVRSNEVFVLKNMPRDILKKYINAVDDKGNTPLIVAARWGSIETVEFLLEVEGIEIRKKGEFEGDALFFAAYHGYQNIVHLLQSKGVGKDFSCSLGTNIKSLFPESIQKTHRQQLKQVPLSFERFKEVLHKENLSDKLFDEMPLNQMLLLLNDLQDGQEYHDIPGRKELIDLIERHLIKSQPNFLSLVKDIERMEHFHLFTLNPQTQIQSLLSIKSLFEKSKRRFLSKEMPKVVEAMIAMLEGFRFMNRDNSCRSLEICYSSLNKVQNFNDFNQFFEQVIVPNFAYLKDYLIRLNPSLIKSDIDPNFNQALYYDAILDNPECFKLLLGERFVYELSGLTKYAQEKGVVQVLQERILEQNLIADDKYPVLIGELPTCRINLLSHMIRHKGRYDGPIVWYQHHLDRFLEELTDQDLTPLIEAIKTSKSKFYNTNRILFFQSKSEELGAVCLDNLLEDTSALKVSLLHQPQHKPCYDPKESLTVKKVNELIKAFPNHKDKILEALLKGSTLTWAICTITEIDTLLTTFPERKHVILLQLFQCQDLYAWAKQGQIKTFLGKHRDAVMEVSQTFYRNRDKKPDEYCRVFPFLYLENSHFISRESLIRSIYLDKDLKQYWYKSKGRFFELFSLLERPEQSILINELMRRRLVSLRKEVLSDPYHIQRMLECPTSHTQIILHLTAGDNLLKLKNHAELLLSLFRNNTLSLENKGVLVRYANRNGWISFLNIKLLDINILIERCPPEGMLGLASALLQKAEAEPSFMNPLRFRMIIHKSPDTVQTFNQALTRSDTLLQSILPTIEQVVAANLQLPGLDKGILLAALFKNKSTVQHYIKTYQDYQTLKAHFCDFNVDAKIRGMRDKTLNTVCYRVATSTPLYKHFLNGIVDTICITQGPTPIGATGRALKNKQVLRLK